MLEEKMELRNKNVLITGIAGFVGSHLCQELLDRGCEVTGIDDFSNGKMANIKHNIKNIRLLHDTIIDKRLYQINSNFAHAKFDVIFHEAALNLVRSTINPEADLRVNALGTLSLLEYIKHKSPHTKLVFASTGSIYGEPQYTPQDEKHPKNPCSPYGISKLAAEMYVNWYAKQHGLKTISLRYYNVVGSRQEYSDMGGVVPIFIKNALQRKPIEITGDGTQTRCFTDVSDVVRANIAAAESEKGYGYGYNIATDEITTINQLAREVCTCVGIEPNIKYVAPRVGDIHDFTPSIRLAQETFGYSPQTKLKDSLPKIITWMSEELRNQQEVE